MSTVRVDKYGHIQVGNLSLTKKDTKADAMIYFFTNTAWALFRNHSYEETIEGEFPNEHYRSVFMVPVYRAFCGGDKVAYLLPREDEITGHRYLMSVSERTNSKTLRKFTQKYYIHSGFDRDFNFIMPTKVTRLVNDRRGYYGP